MDSFIKWAGSKRRLAPAIVELFADREWDCYLEPFCGSASMFFALPSTLKVNRCILADDNFYLTNALRQVMRDPDAVSSRLDGLRDSQRELGHIAFYAWLKTLLEKEASFAQAAVFLALNQLCYNGLWRESKKSGFNVPIGWSGTKDNKRYRDIVVPNLFDWAGYMQSMNTQVATASFWMNEMETRPYPMRWELSVNDVAYLDPPYLDQFSSYTANGFGPEEHADLVRWAREQTDGRGSRVVISGANNEATRRIYGKPTLVLGREDCIGVGTRRATSECVFVFD